VTTNTQAVIDALQRETNAAVLATGADPDRLRAVAQALTAERRHLLALVAELQRTVDTAARMRVHQRRYFDTRMKTALEESKRLEREFDSLLDPAPMLPGLEVRR